MVKDNPAFLYGTCSFLILLLSSLISCDYNSLDRRFVKYFQICGQLNRYSFFFKCFGNENGVERVYSANDFRSFG